MATYTTSATTADVCSCCGTLTAVTLQCRNRGGTATICGYDEYGAPSSPPKKYARRTLDGVRTFCYHTDSGCTAIDTAAPGFNTVYAGYCEYEACAENNVSGLRTLNSLDASCSPTSPFNSDARCAILTSPNTVVENTSTTLRTYTDDSCLFEASVSRWIKRTGTQTETLSEEDTEQDALDRLLAGSGGTWSTWDTSGSGGCSGPPYPCCLARWEERTSGFSFTYQEAQYRVTASGLNPSTSYSARVEIYRRTFGSGTYTLFQTLIVSGTTDGSGAFSEDGDVPNEKGFESYAYAAYIVIPS